MMRRRAVLGHEETIHDRTVHGMIGGHQLVVSELRAFRLIGQSAGRRQTCD